ncbi:sensor histidine kinase [Vulcaniibacterium gelatinicum]|uniref:sensor histidine kinase n=1 Tax=Vulcaniibacterium gelatinicum TaxID=2598725 RepID=UPI0011C85972|nr:CHASE domain-containing protein [Vulcaniibacterium gelatinicum]
MTTPTPQEEPRIGERVPRSQVGYLLAWLVLAGSLALVLVAWRTARERELRAYESEFRASSQEVADLIGQRLVNYELLLRGGVALFATVARPTPTQWRAFVEGFQLERFPGLTGLGFAPWLTQGGLIVLQEETRAAGFGLLDVWPRGVRPHYAPILYLEPRTRENLLARGYDIHSDPVRRASLLAVLDSGQLQLSGRVQLVQDSGKAVPGLVLYAPVYRAGDLPRTPAARRLSMQGWLFAPFRVEAMVASTLRLSERSVRFRILDVTGGRPQLLYADAGFAEAQAAGDRLSHTVEAEHYGRRWRFEFVPATPPAQSEGMRTLQGLLAIGVLASLLLFGLAWMLAHTEQRALRIAARMTEAYRQSEAEVRALNRTLEARVAARTRELSEANRELEAFAYSISHDLRSPLRAIGGFSKVLGDRYAAVLDETGRDYLGRVVRAAAHMDELIDALLALTRIGRGELRREPVDLGRIAAEIVSELRAAEPEHRVEVAIAPGLHAHADAGLVRALLQNLIGNAWKFTRGREPARIEVGRDPDGAFHVRDNGVGFDPAYAGKLFQPFQRLHGREEFAGHGIGLATVKRIVERHGGTVQAEGAPGQGATFRFTLPEEGN